MNTLQIIDGTRYITKESQSKVLTEVQYSLLNKRMEIYNEIENLKRQYEDITLQIQEVNESIEDIWRY